MILKPHNSRILNEELNMTFKIAELTELGFINLYTLGQYTFYFRGGRTKICN
jgi:hypothetical protein